VRELANDVTLSGAEEPAAYISESFEGDGTTTVFLLSEAAYRDTNRTLVLDSFNEAAFDAAQWMVNDPGSHVSLTSAGLTLNGGNGFDGQTTVEALDAVEMGGSVVAQLGGVMLAAASDGMLAGMYQGTPVLANCFAGFRVRQSVSGTGGVTVIVPVVNGVELGTVFTAVAGHAYTLRLRLHCVEMQRVQQRYYCMVDGVIEGFGSASGVSAPMDVVFELVDEGAASNTSATVLYDGDVRVCGGELDAAVWVGGFGECDATGKSLGGEHAAWRDRADAAGGCCRARAGLRGFVWNGCWVTGQGDVLCGARTGCGRAGDGELSRRAAGCGAAGQCDERCGGGEAAWTARVRRRRC
jgi:hypothetical protein